MARNAGNEAHHGGGVVVVVVRLAEERQTRWGIRERTQKRARARTLDKEKETETNVPCDDDMVRTKRRSS